MAKPPEPAAPALSREERLAAKLRENLHRRKAQARSMKTGDGGNGAEIDSAALSKAPPES